MTTKPDVVSMLQVSTHHLSARTQIWLDRQRQFHAVPLIFCSGWLVCVEDDGVGLPEDLRLVLQYAGTHGCTWVKFDDAVSVSADIKRLDDYLNKLCALTLVEENRELTADEIKQYMFYVEALKDANIEIPFGIEY